MEEETAVTDDSCKEFCFEGKYRPGAEGTIEGKLLRDQYVVHAWFPRSGGNWFGERAVNSYEV